MTRPALPRASQLAVLAVVIAGCLVLPPAVWSATWRVVSAPAPRWPSGSLLGLSCVTRADCLAVGQYTPLSNSTRALVERWTGRRWTIERFRLRGHPVSGALDGISCPSARTCMAVGQLEDPYGGGLGAVAARLSGRRWSPAGPARGPRAASALTSVACWSARGCQAVGYRSYDVGRDRPVLSVIAAERWNGKRWRVERAPGPPGRVEAALNGVSCPTPRVCIAVGHSGQRLVIERRRAGRWSAMRVFSPRDGGALNAIACPSPSVCMAVGTHGAGEPLAERWNGRRWRPVPTPEAARGQVLQAVACSSAGACTAVSSASKYGGFGDALVWHGRRWHEAPLPIPREADHSNQLDAVWCAAAGRCLAVGSSDGGVGAATTLAVAETGSAWRVLRTPNAQDIGGGSLEAVSCATATSCLAVGEFFDALGNSRPLLERWSARAGWALEGASVTASAPRGGLNGVSCLPTGTCVAVGRSGELIEHPPRSRAGPAETYHADYPLNAVSCTSESACLAVGALELAVPSTPPLEVWDGTAWAPESVPALATGDFLAGVSCPSPQFCAAVGSVLATWNGSAWTVQPVASPPGSTATLSGVDCVSAGWCLAVGAAVSPDRQGTPIAEVWNGATWTLQQLPNPAGSSDTHVRAVSCTSPTACTAVGSYTTRVPFFAIYTASWDGTRWTLQRPAVPAGATQSALDGVSCTAPQTCVAAGIDFAPRVTGILIERLS